MEQNKVYIKHIKYQIKIIKMLNYRKKDLKKLVVIVIEFKYIEYFIFLYLFSFILYYLLYLCMNIIFDISNIYLNSGIVQ
jgi:hypothetical protein